MKPRPTVAVVTCVEIPEPDPDLVPLLEALDAAGLDADELAWDSPVADPSVFDLCVLRTCWNYHRDPVRFLRWLDSAARVTMVLNDVALVRWNVHKRYLAALADRGIATVPTAYVAENETTSLRAIASEHGWTDVVVKPAISAASFRTKRFHGESLREGESFLTEVVRHGDAMIQPYVASVEGVGERSIVWIDGAITHAIRKTPRFSDDEEDVSDALPVHITEERLARATLEVIGSLVPGEMLYARVDIVRDDGGRPMVAEVELIEPSLFLEQCEEAKQRLVEGIVARVAGEQSKG